MVGKIMGFRATQQQVQQDYEYFQLFDPDESSDDEDADDFDPDVHRLLFSGPQSQHSNKKQPSLSFCCSCLKCHCFACLHKYNRYY